MKSFISITPATFIFGMAFIHRRRRGGNTGFTILSDTLLQMIGVFVVLVVFLLLQWATTSKVAEKVPGLETQVTGLEAELEDAEEDLIRSNEEGEKKDGTIITLQKQVGQQGEYIDLLTEEVASLQPGGPLTVCIMLDVSLSMGDVIDELLSAMIAIFAVAPELTSEFSIGVVAFRTDVVDTFPVTVIKPKSEDGGKSQQAVVTFLEELEAKKGFTDHEKAFYAAVEVLRVAEKDGTRSVLMLMGDIGVSELDEARDKDLPTAGGFEFSDRERRLAQSLVTSIHKWASRGNRTIGTLFAESESTERNPSVEDSRQWYRDLAYPSSSNAYTDPSQMLGAILGTIKSQGDSK